MQIAKAHRMQIKTTIGLLGYSWGWRESSNKKTRQKSHVVVEELSKVGLCHLKILTRSTLQNRTKLTIAGKKDKAL